MTTAFHPGQRWISTTEPELGLGVVERISPLTVTVAYRAAGETREYARDNAPLRRVRFHPGDRVKDRGEVAFIVRGVREERGQYLYRADGREVLETELSDAITFSTPKDRLFAGQADPPRLFDLRATALEVQHLRRRSEVRGFAGGRLDLIPHQLYIAGEVSRRLVPRVLLADEVGLGKTIEAGLILHRLLLTGRAQRVLILTPDSLVHQWLVEMLRRFNLWFHIFDEERCAAIETANPGANPFLEDQLVLASLRLFTGSPKRVEQARAAGWDLLVVDEAHHLAWSPQEVSPEYRAVETLSGAAPGLLLLTATPEQLGMASHFARLRLLDPARFHDLEEFQAESLGYLEVARTAAGLEDGDALSDLLDRHGTGRVMFRNTRATITGFPRRIPSLCRLSAGAESALLLDRLRSEFRADVEAFPASDRFRPDFADDPRIAWLAGLLAGLGRDKVLLICRSQAKTEAIEAALRSRVNVRMALFHEGLSLVQRDRQAAWFSEDDGARLLIASEIGSEGRNFQFAHHLVLFDLPLDPEVLEQRIGRLDRIGQAAEITLHVPFVAGSPQEVLARWYDAGLHAFERNLHGAHELFERFGPRVRSLAGSPAFSEEEISSLLAETVSARAEVTHRLEQGRDLLLEMNSFRPEPARRLAGQIGEWDRDRRLDAFMMRVLDHFTVPVEQIAPRTYRLGSAGVLVEDFPGLPPSGLTVTCDRARALAREDEQFLTWDHPLVSGALDLMLGSERGNASFARWPGGKEGEVYLESLFVLESVAPPRLHVDRFLAPAPLRILVDGKGRDVGATAPPASFELALKSGDPAVIRDGSLREEGIPRLLEACESLARERARALIARARRDMSLQLDHEISRLVELQKVNRSVRPEEIDLLIQEKSALDEHLAGARLRLDALRLILGGREP